MTAKAGLWAPILSLFGPNSRNIRPNYLLIQRLSRAQHRSNEVVLEEGFSRKSVCRVGSSRKLPALERIWRATQPPQPPCRCCLRVFLRCSRSCLRCTRSCLRCSLRSSLCASLLPPCRRLPERTLVSKIAVKMAVPSSRTSKECDTRSHSPYSAKGPVSGNCPGRSPANTGAYIPHLQVVTFGIIRSCLQPV